MYFDLDSLLPWVREQRANGCSYEQLVWALSIEQGYAWHVAHRIVEACLQYGGNNGQLFSQAPIDARPVPEPRFSRLGQYEFAQRTVTLSLVNAFPKIAFFDNVASSQECEALMAHARSRRVRSTVTVDTGSEENEAVRNSTTAYLHDREHPVAAALRERIAQLLQWPVANCERLQLQHYGVGQHYKPHHDYFDPILQRGSQLLQTQGNRIATAILYLNQPKRGGGTYFASLGLEVSPRPGSVLFFSYPEQDATSMSLHAGSPVEEGEKWIATVWFRQGVPLQNGGATPS